MPKGKPRSNAEIFWSHVIAGGEDDCWIWQGGKRGQYGSGYWSGKRESAHRVSYLLHKGNIPAGLDILHSCDTPLCVNPKHLRPGTHLENMKERDSKHRRKAVLGEKNNLSKLNAEQVTEIRRLRKAGMPVRSIGKLFGVTGVCISLICTRQTWMHLPDPE